MKATKLILLVLLVAILSCDEDDNRSFVDENGRFVRFFLQLDRDNNPLEFPAIDPGIIPTAVFEKDDFTTLKIPVALTSTPLDQVITVNFETEINGLSNLEITPANQLTFSGTQLIDTVFVKINERWDPADSPSLRLQLTNSSNPDIQIGVPYESRPLDELIINFNEVGTPTYGIEPPTRVDVQGVNGETYQLNVNFPEGYIESEVDQAILLTEIQSNYDYLLAPLPITDSSNISYTFQVNEDFTDEAFNYNTTLALGTIPEYELDGFPLISYLRSPIIPRDPDLNTASNFYDLSDQFYRVYGVTWMDFDEDGICEWRDFNTFTVPVEVESTNDFAVLGNDNGTSDPSDDIYYHAFLLGFEPPAGSTTNSFNLRRWFTNESTSSVNSPGLNINPALEFFPDDDTSRISGTVEVVQKTIQIGTRPANGNSSIRKFIAISGSGTYRQLPSGIIDIDFTLNATNNDLFGGTRVARYHLYNDPNFTDPADLSEDCFVPIPIQ